MTIPAPVERPIDEAANFDEMAENSRIIGSKQACLGDLEGAAYWRGRARGLKLAAINVRAAARETEAPATASRRAKR